MKRVFVLSLMLSAGSASNAQKIDVTKVPEPARRSFEKAYPGTKAKWEKEKENYEVNFNQNGQTMSAVIQPNGDIIETETDIQITALPSQVLLYLKENYNNKTIKEAAEITKADGTLVYEAEISGIDLLFDAGGKFIKQVKD